MKASLLRYALLSLVLGMAGFLRFYGIETRGLLADDEGFYAGAVKTYVALSNYLADKLLGIQHEGLVPYFSQYGGNPVLGTRPTFVVLGFLASFVVGMHDYTVIYVSAIFGVLGVLCVYLFCTEVLKSEQLGILAALLLAISPLHVAYSRTGYADMTAGTIAWYALLCYLLARREGRCDRKWLWSGALAMGAAFVTHPSLWWALVILFVAEIGQSRQVIAGRCLAKHLFTFGGLMVAPAIFWEGALRAARLIIATQLDWVTAFTREANVSRISGAFFTLLDGFKSAVDTTTNPASLLVHAPPPEYSYYLRLLCFHEGIPIVILGVAGIAMLIAKQRDTAGSVVARRLLVLFAIVPLALFSLFYYYPKHPAPRLVLVVMPALTICAAIFVNTMQKALEAKWGYYGWMVVGGMLVATAIQELSYAAEVIPIRSGFPEAVRYMGSHEGLKHLSDHMYISRVYVGRQNAVDNYVSIRATDEDRGYRHISTEKLKGLYANGYHYFVRVPGLLYTNETVMLTGGTYLLPETVREPSVKPVYEVYHPQGDYWPPEIRRSDRDTSVPQKLSIYLLRDIISRLEQDNGKIGVMSQ